MRLLALLLGLGIALPAGAQGSGAGAPWHSFRGEALSISIARDGFIVAAGRDARLWTWRTADAAWMPLAGEGVRTAALPGGRYFAIRRDGALTFFDGLRIAPAGLRALDVAADSAGNPYAIRDDGALVRRTAAGGAWEELGAVGGRRLAVAPDNSVWVALATGRIGRWVDGRLEPRPGSARELAIGAGGVILAVDRDGALQRWAPFSSSWEPEPAPPDLAAIALDPQSIPWAATSSGAIFTRAALPQATVWLDADSPGEGGITFKRRARRAGAETTASGASRDLRRGTYVAAVNPPAQVTDPAPIEWIDTLATAASLSIAGRDGSVFALDASGNAARWSNQQRRFTPFPGQFAKIAVEPNGNPWGINPVGRVFRRDASIWHQINGTASDLSIGVNGRIMATTPAGELFQYDRAADALLRLPGLLFSVAVAPDGVPWGLLQDGTVVRCPTPLCQRFTKTALNLAIGPEGSVFIVTTDNFLWRLNKAQDGWDLIPVLGLKVLSVAVGPRGRPWVVTAGGEVYASTFFPRDESTDLLEASTTSDQSVGDPLSPSLPSLINPPGFVFTKCPVSQSIPVPAGAQRVSIGPDGTVLMFLGSTGLVRYDPARKVFVTVTGLPPASIAHAKTGPDGKLWIISADGDGLIYHQLSGSNYERLQLPDPSPGSGSLQQRIDVGPDGAVYALNGAGTVYRSPPNSKSFTKFIPLSYYNLAIAGTNDLWVVADAAKSSPGVHEVVKGVAVQRWPYPVLDMAGGKNGSLYAITFSDTGFGPARWNATNRNFDQLCRAWTADFIGVDPTGRPWAWLSDNPTVILRAK